MIDVHIVAGARPNFMKIAPFYKALHGQAWANPVIVHTGQHYSHNMSDTFFEELGLPQPHFHLGATGATQARQTASIMVAYEDLALTHPPGWVVVVGDVNSTIAACLAAKKLNLKVAHLEAGLRNFDHTLPEEINRVLTDAISDLLWTPSPDADENLLREGIQAERIDRVGNIMIDCYVMMEARIAAAGMPERIGVERGRYLVTTMHRPANVDDRAGLEAVVDALLRLSERLEVVFPVHPRTRKNLEAAGLWDRLGTHRLHLLEPLGYVDFMSLVAASALVLTDSGGVQEETSYLGIPCLTLRPNTERPITVTRGTNRLVTLESLAREAEAAIAGRSPERPRIDLWDGRAAERAVASLARHAGVA